MQNVLFQISRAIISYSLSEKMFPKNEIKRTLIIFNTRTITPVIFFPAMM